MKHTWLGYFWDFFLRFFESFSSEFLIKIQWPNWILTVFVKVIGKNMITYVLLLRSFGGMVGVDPAWGVVSPWNSFFYQSFIFTIVPNFICPGKRGGVRRWHLIGWHPMIWEITDYHFHYLCRFFTYLSSLLEIYSEAHFIYSSYFFFVFFFARTLNLPYCFPF